MDKHEHHRKDDELTADEVKLAMKDAIKEWLDERFAEFGRWTMNAILAALFAALIYFIAYQNGWRHIGPVVEFGLPK